MKEFDLNDKINLPTNTITKHIIDYYIIFAPEYPNWIVLDENEYKLFCYLLNNDIKRSMLNLRDIDKIEESSVVDVANSVLYKIENAQFYADTNIQKEIEMKKITKAIHVNVTNDCNLRCKHCYMSAGVGEKKELCKEKLLSFVENITALNGTTDIVISGGEPLLYKDIFDIIIAFKKLGHKIILFTNGLLINESNIEFISNNVDEVQISMEGISCKFFELIRGNGKYKQLVNALRLLEAEDVPITLAITVLDDVLFDVKENIISFLNDFNFKNINVRINDKIELKGNMLLYNNGHTIDEQEKKLAVISIIKELADNGYYVVNEKERNIHFTNCGIGTSININFDGKIYPCSEFSCDYYDLDTSPEYIIAQFNILNERSSMEFMDICTDCEIKYICNGGCRVKNFLIEDSYIKPACNDKYKEKKYYGLLMDYLYKENKNAL